MPRLLELAKKQPQRVRRRLTLQKRKALFFANSRNHVLGAKILEAEGCQQLAHAVVVLVIEGLDFEPFLVTERVEVLEREHADVRRVIPLVGQFLGYRHAAMNHKRPAC